MGQVVQHRVGRSVAGLRDQSRPGWPPSCTARSGPVPCRPTRRRGSTRRGPWGTSTAFKPSPLSWLNGSSTRTPAAWNTPRSGRPSDSRASSAVHAGPVADVELLDPHVGSAGTQRLHRGLLLGGGGTPLRPASTIVPAPLAASHVAVARPKSPRPPVIRYAPSGRIVGGRSGGLHRWFGLGEVEHHPAHVVGPRDQVETFG